MTAVIELEHVRKAYGAKVAVADVTLTVERGEIVGILGRNGAGKTTTVEILAGLRTPDAGSVRVLGVDPGHDPATLRQHLGIQLQESRLPARLTVAEALRLYASFYDHPAEPDDLIALLGLAEKRDTAFKDLSGGQQQRLSIALALVGNPEIAVLDELTTGLDPQARRETWALIERVRDTGVTIVLVTHFMDEAERLCDRVVIVDDGRVVAAGTPSALTSAPDGRRTFRMRLPRSTPADVVDAALRRPEVTDVHRAGDDIDVTGTRRVLPAVLLALAEHDVVPEEIRTLTRSLKDVFVDVVGTAPQEALT